MNYWLKSRINQGESINQFQRKQYHIYTIYINLFDEIIEIIVSNKITIHPLSPQNEL